MKKVILQDLANELGLSKALVSSVLNGNGDKIGISKATQERVEKLAKEMNYRPNMIARALKTQEIKTIGLIVSDISNPFYSNMARSIEDELSKQDYNLIIGSTDEDLERETELISLLIERGVDGFIISTSQLSNKIIVQLHKERFPFVMVDRHLSNIDCNYVVVNNHDGAREGVEHLINHGFKKIAFFSISPAHISTIRDRLLGYKNALKSNRIRGDRKLICDIPYDKIDQSVAEKLNELLKPPHSIDAVFASNNNIALACMKYFNEKNIRVPQDIAFISFDDINLFEFSSPKITAIRQPVDAISYESVNLLLRDIKARKNSTNFESKQIVLKTDLIVRESCGVAFQKKIKVK